MAPRSRAGPNPNPNPDPNPNPNLVEAALVEAGVLAPLAALLWHGSATLTLALTLALT